MYGLLNIMAGGQGAAPVPPTPTLNWFYLEDASGAANTVSIKKIRNEGAPTLTIETSTNGTTWTTLGNTSLTALNINVPAGGKVYVRCNAANWSSDSALEYNCFNTATGDFNVGGNIMSLLYGSNFDDTETTFPTGSRMYVLASLFRGNTHLVDASALELPAATLKNSCYAWMFMDCTALTTAPELDAPVLARECYNGMFANCSSLTEITCLAYDISAVSCTLSWVYGVSPTGTFYKGYGMSSWTTGTSGIPSGWTVIEM